MIYEKFIPTTWEFSPTQWERLYFLFILIMYNISPVNQWRKLSDNFTLINRLLYLYCGCWIVSDIQRNDANIAHYNCL